MLDLDKLQIVGLFDFDVAARRTLADGLDAGTITLPMYSEVIDDLADCSGEQSADGIWHIV